jgi:hypothetical protein
MAGIVTFNSLGGRTILSLSYSRVNGEGPVQRAVFTLDGRASPDTQVLCGFGGGEVGV